MLRYAEDAPAAQAEFPVYLTITITVASDLGLPEYAISLGSPITLRTAVPKTSIHEHDEA
jgi:hypothetical protein